MEITLFICIYGVNNFKHVLLKHFLLQTHSSSSESMASFLVSAEQSDLPPHLLQQLKQQKQTEQQNSKEDDDVNPIRLLRIGMKDVDIIEKMMNLGEKEMKHCFEALLQQIRKMEEMQRERQSVWKCDGDIDNDNNNIYDKKNIDHINGIDDRNINDTDDIKRDERMKKTINGQSYWIRSHDQS